MVDEMRNLGESQPRFCAICGCDLNNTPPSRMDSHYCTFCQSESSGSFENTHYKIALKFIINQILIGLYKMKPREAQAIAVALIKQNPLIIRKAGCTN